MLTTSTLHQRAVEILRERGLEPEFPEGVVRQAEIAAQQPPLPDASLARRDLRALLWSSIDSPGARDLDQVEYVEADRGAHGDSAGPITGYRVLVGIADVSALVPPGSALDRFAAARGTSVYTGAEVFPLLPPCLTQEATSLLPGHDRRAIVTEIHVDAAGSIRSSTVYSALVQNKARLGYDECGAWLEAMEQHQEVVPPTEMAAVPGLTEQIMLQWFAARALRLWARRRGALEIELAAAAAVVQNGSIVNLTLRRRTLARTIIETFMLAANTAATDFLHARNLSSIERIVHLPERWPRLQDLARERGGALPSSPDSEALALFLEQQSTDHPEQFLALSQIVAKLIGSGRYEMIAPTQNMSDFFGPDVSGYTHSTAPNRRYADLAVQRQVKSALDAHPPAYTDDDLRAIAEQCNRQIAAARRAEREIRKVAAAELLTRSIGDEFEAIVTAVKSDHAAGVYARATHRPVEGRITEGRDPAVLKVGDTVQVRLARVDPERGWIDFELL